MIPMRCQRIMQRVSFDPDNFDIEKVIKFARKIQIDPIQIAEYIGQYEEKSEMKLPEPYKSLLESLNHPQNAKKLSRDTARDRLLYSK